MTVELIQTRVGADKPRSYDGDYMQAGNIGIEKVFAFLKGNPNVLEVDDWQDLKKVQKADVDCAIYMRDGTVPLAEVKYDKHLGVSGNVLFEVLRINHTCDPEHACILGWSQRSPATFFMFYSPVLNKIYICKAADLRKAMQNYTKDARRDTFINYVETDNIKSTVNILIPWEYCEKIFKIYDAGQLPAPALGVVNT